jgi:hypothetical protein
VRIITDIVLVTVFVRSSCLMANLDGWWVVYQTATLGIDLLWRGVQAGVALQGASYTA